MENIYISLHGNAINKFWLAILLFWLPHNALFCHTYANPLSFSISFYVPIVACLIYQTDCITNACMLSSSFFLTTNSMQKSYFRTLLDDNNVQHTFVCCINSRNGGMVCVHLRHTFTVILRILCALACNDNSNNTFYLSLDDYVCACGSVNSRYVKTHTLILRCECTFAYLHHMHNTNNIFVCGGYCIECGAYMHVR